MSSAIAFEPYNKNAVSAQFSRLAEQDQHAGTDYWLSSFNIPTSIGVQPRAGDCLFMFEYSDAEQPEPKPRALPGDRGIQVLLAKQTKKILQVLLPSALLPIQKREDWFDSRLVWKWAVDLPDRQAKVLTRNAQIIGHILSRMPEPVRREVLDHLRAAKRR